MIKSVEIKGGLLCIDVDSLDDFVLFTVFSGLGYPQESAILLVNLYCGGNLTIYSDVLTRTIEFESTDTVKGKDSKHDVLKMQTPNLTLN